MKLRANLQLNPSIFCTKLNEIVRKPERKFKENYLKESDFQFSNFLSYVRQFRPLLQMKYNGFFWGGGETFEDFNPPESSFTYAAGY